MVNQETVNVSPEKNSDELYCGDRFPVELILFIAKLLPW